MINDAGADKEEEDIEEVTINNHKDQDRSAKTEDHLRHHHGEETMILHGCLRS